MTKLLLDTHIWVPLVLGEPSIPKAMLAEIEKASKQRSVYVSAISVWEVAQLGKRQRIRLNKPYVEWLEEAIAVDWLHVVPLTAEIAIESIELPGAFHADPADRFLVATARRLGLAFATLDKKILAYAAQGNLAVIR